MRHRIIKMPPMTSPCPHCRLGLFHPLPAPPPGVLAAPRVPRAQGGGRRVQGAGAGAADTAGGAQGRDKGESKFVFSTIFCLHPAEGISWRALVGVLGVCLSIPPLDVKGLTTPMKAVNFTRLHLYIIAVRRPSYFPLPPRRRSSGGPSRSRPRTSWGCRPRGRQAQSHTPGCCTPSPRAARTRSQ